jgi:AraC family transcriptional regulator
MNYYERVQKAIDYIESNLENGIDLEKVAAEAYMSSSNFYRLFFALTGFTVKEYIRQRRISGAASYLKEGTESILDIALRHGFESNEAFTRAFKRLTGYPPSAFRKSKLTYYFERVNLMDKYFDIQDPGLLEKYPDIKVLKELEPVRVAYYRYYGRNPEAGAFTVIRDWLKKSGLNMGQDRLRIFGFDNPSPSGPNQKEYGYEVWVTINDDYAVNDSLVKTKTFPGGLYAVCGVKNFTAGGDGAAIFQTWRRFSRWLKDSKYTHGNHQWLEEHLHFNEQFEHTGGIDLYMPMAQ